MSRSCPASAMACAWLPDEKVTTPRRRSSAAEPRQRVVRAAELEGACALEVLALEEHLGAGASVDGARGGDGRADARRRRSAVPRLRCRRRLGVMRAASKLWRVAMLALGFLSGDAGWSSPVARWAHNPKVAGSNPAPANPFNTSSIATTVAALRSCGHDLNPRLVVVLAVQRSPEPLPS